MTRSEILAAIEALYNECDIPPPSVAFPIAPLGPLLDNMAILWTELPGLTSDLAEKHLMQKGGLREPFPAGVTNTTPLSGFLYIAGGSMAHVFLRREDVLVRRRFSLAHELGHIRLHFSPEAEVFHDRFGVEEGDEEKAHLERESEANQFAAELLLPEAVVRDLADKGKCEGFWGPGLAEELAMQMLVSREAMLKRLGDLKIDMEAI
ncbi:MAG: ImmA/IrrE family metallo-endopeptidase [Armatimonadetes bacterium]|nr:ImmA/IrrE family metallo-endopeptidase [Armatimonadota bacterium]